MKKDRSKKLTLNKETLRDLMAKNAGEVKGAARTNGRKCQPSGGGPTRCGPTCPTEGCTTNCWYTTGCW
jgi:hypothetical protein